MVYMAGEGDSGKGQGDQGGAGNQQSDDDFDEEEESEGGEGSGAGEEKYDEARALKTIKAQRESEKKLKKDLHELRDELKQIKEKDLPAAERSAAAEKELTERAEKAEASLRKASVRTDALEHATQLGFRNPTLAYKLIDLDDVDWDGEEPSNIRQLLRDQLASDPYLKGRRTRAAGEEGEEEEEDADAGAGRGRKPKVRTMNDMIRESAGH